MDIFIGLLIIAAGAFCQSSSYTPINKVREWSWETYWFVQGVFAWLVFPLLGALLAVPDEESLTALYASYPRESLLTIFFGMLWGVGGLTFGLSMRYLGVALGQSLALGTCAGLGTILTPLFLGKPGDLTSSVIIGVVVTLAGIAVIGIAGHMKSSALSEEEKKKAIEEYRTNFANPYKAAELGYIDEIILPRQTRAKLIQALDMTHNKIRSNPPKKHGNMPL